MPILHFGMPTLLAKKREFSELCPDDTGERVTGTTWGGVATAEGVSSLPEAADACSCFARHAR